MYIFGLCGRSGSGKSTACGFLKEKGFYCINADEVCHRIYETNKDCINELSKAFGNRVVKDGKIDRSVLRIAVFEKDDGISKLNAITHKYILKSILNEAKEAFERGVRFVVVDAPTLYESGLYEYCDATIAIVASDENLINRLVVRDALPKQALRKRLMAQKSNKELVSATTRVVFNDGTLLELRKNIFLVIMLALIEVGVVRCSEEVKRYVLKKT